MARTKDKRFTDLSRSVDLGSFARLNMAQRLYFLDTVDGRSILSSSRFTAEDLASLFPYNTRTNKEKLKSVLSGNYDQSMPGDQGGGVPSTLRDRATKGGYSRDRSDPGAKAQLSKEQKEVFDLLQKGEISADDPRVAFLKNISDDDLKKAGIQKMTGEDGKVSYKSDPTKATQMSEEELAASVRARNVPGGSPYLAEMRKQYVDELNNNPELKDRFMRAMRAEAGGRTDKLADVMEATFNRAHMKGHSIDQELRSGFFGPVNRGDPNYTRPLENSVRESGNEALNQVAQGRNRIQLRTDQGMVTDPGGRVYETMPDKSGKLNFGDGNNYYFMGDRGRQWYQQQEQARQNYDMAHAKPEGGPITREQIAEERTRLSAEEVQRRQQNLAMNLGRQQQGQQPPAQTRVGEDGRPLYIAGDSIGVGVGQSVQGARSVAVGGKHFTDRSDDPNGPIAQLNRVPPGSRVQLYIGTNDANSGRLDPATYQKRMEEIKRIADEKGLDVSIHGPHMSTPARNPRITENIPAVNDMLGSAARAHGFRYVDNTSVVADEGDRIHLSGRGYRNLYERGLPPSQTEVQQAQVEQPVPSFPDGGEVQTEADSLQVYSLDKSKVQRDDMLAVDGDGKPVFTMNSKEEMKFDPNTGNVEVNSGAKGYRNEPMQLGPEPAKPMESAKTGTEEKIDAKSEEVSNHMAMKPLPSYTESSHNSSDVSLTITENIFKSPSFERAMARARFLNTSDALGGNFDFGAANMV